MRYCQDGNRLRKSLRLRLRMPRPWPPFIEKRGRGDLGHTLVREVVELFQRDWQSFIRVEVTDELNGYIDRAVKGYPLRGFDAIHLASAMVIHERLTEGFVFACFDDRLARAARSEQLETFPLADAAEPEQENRH
jgi:hypothetical protein